MKNVLIGHCDNQFTGVTAVIFPEGAIGGVDVRGGAPGTRETDLLKNGNSVEKINAVMLAGGSAFGLDAASGMMKFLSEKGWGFRAGKHIVPIVTAAILYDLNDEVLHFPNAEMGYKACQNASADNYANGSIGAGKGATVGKIMGIEAASKGGIGSATINIGSAKITAVIAVNAFGDVFDSKSDKIVAGARLGNGTFLNTSRLMMTTDLSKMAGGTNTTIGVVFTDAKLSKEQTNKLASVAHNGLALSISPVHTMADGDTLFAASAGEQKVEFNSLCVCAVEAVRQAILAAVKQ